MVFVAVLIMLGNRLRPVHLIPPLPPLLDALAKPLPLVLPAARPAVPPRAFAAPALPALEAGAGVVYLELAFDDVGGLSTKDVSVVKKVASGSGGWSRPSERAKSLDCSK